MPAEYVIKTVPKEGLGQKKGKLNWRYYLEEGGKMW